MPPKSAKKDHKSLWVACDKCGVKVVTGKSKLHEKECGSACSGIINNEYNTTTMKPSLPPEIDIKDAPVVYLQRFLFIPESICTLCNFTMGCNLVVNINQRKFVRSSWTVNDKHVDAIFSNSEGNEIILKRIGS